MQFALLLGLLIINPRPVSYKNYVSMIVKILLKIASLDGKRIRISYF